MNRLAYLTTSLVIKTIENISRARIHVHGTENIPKGSIIFVVNHFTRLETLLLPYHIYNLTDTPVWSLAAAELFKGPLGWYLDKVGTVSTKDPDRDLLIVKTLLTGEAHWIIFPEGRMVKNKKIIEKGRFMISYAGGKRLPHTGAATLALRTEFYRERLKSLSGKYLEEVSRLMELFQIDDIDPVRTGDTVIVPTNITYYPIKATENILSKLAEKFAGDIPERAMEEVMIEGTMLLSGVDVDIRFGKPIFIKDYLKEIDIERDIAAKRQFNFDDPIASKRHLRRVALSIMQRYMSEIYSLTTVNQDHLFASILRQYPLNKINTRDFRRRVFMATTLDFDKMGVYSHKSISSNTISLLTNDRHHKFRNFIALAQEKGIVKKKGEFLEKIYEKLSPDLADTIRQFHYIRIDNPIAVMANEVEPLTVLQQNIRRLAWQPTFLLKRRLVSYLLGKSISEFEQDYKTFYIKGESKTKDVGRPFLIKGRSRDMGVVLVHGYMSAPLEVRELAEYLGSKGLWVYVPRLRGHGTSPTDLAIRTYRDWIASVELGYAIISSICRRVVAGGFSTGAGLALDLAAKVGHLQGVFAVCTPLKLQNLSAGFAKAVDVLNRLVARVRPQIKKEFVENCPENPNINYFRNPISGVRELERLMGVVKARLPEIRIPALVIQSDNDPVANPIGSKQVFELLGSKDKTYILFNFNRHVIVRGKGAERVHSAIGDFIKQL